MIEWIIEHYKILSGIAIPVVVAIIGLFARKKLIKKKNTIAGNSNNMLVAEGDISNSQSFNPVNQSGAHGTTQIVGNYNQVANFDLQSVQILAENLKDSHKKLIDSLFND